MDLREARFKRRLTQWSLRLMTGIHQTKISLMENGFVVPNEREKKALAKALQVRPNDIEWPANERMGQS